MMGKKQGKLNHLISWGNSTLPIEKEESSWKIDDLRRDIHPLTFFTIVSSNCCIISNYALI